METKQQDLGKKLQEAVLQAAMPAEDGASVSVKNPKTDRKQAPASPRNGQPVPTGAGRPVGVKNKLTNLRDAVLEAFDTVGGAEYLAKLAQGTSSDRAAFVSLVSKVLPTQVNANVEGGVQIQLSWLGSRSIGTTTAQNLEPITQVVDLQKDSAGKYRIIDQDSASPGAADAGGGGSKAQEPAGGPIDA